MNLAGLITELLCVRKVLLQILPVAVSPLERAHPSSEHSRLLFLLKTVGPVVVTRSSGDRDGSAPKEEQGSAVC